MNSLAYLSLAITACTSVLLATSADAAADDSRAPVSPAAAPVVTVESHFTLGVASGSVGAISLPSLGADAGAHFHFLRGHLSAGGTLAYKVLSSNGSTEDGFSYQTSFASALAGFRYTILPQGFARPYVGVDAGVTYFRFATRDLRGSGEVGNAAFEAGAYGGLRLQIHPRVALDARARWSYIPLGKLQYGDRFSSGAVSLAGGDVGLTLGF